MKYHSDRLPGVARRQIPFPEYAYETRTRVHISSRSVARDCVLLWMTDTFRLFWAEMGRPVSRKLQEFGVVYKYANQNRRRLCVPT